MAVSQMFFPDGTEIKSIREFCPHCGAHKRHQSAELGMAAYHLMRPEYAPAGCNCIGCREARGEAMINANRTT